MSALTREWWRRALPYVFIGAVLVVWGCDECDEYEERCVGNQPQGCYCDDGPCVWDVGYPDCAAGRTCIEEGDRVACTTSEPCPDGRRESHCTSIGAVQCFGGLLIRREQCPDDRPCKVFEEGAFCGAPPGYCVENGIPTCQTGNMDYVVCEDRYPETHECPRGTQCDPSVEQGDPCRPTRGEAVMSRLDGG